MSDNMITVIVKIALKKINLMDELLNPPKMSILLLSNATAVW